VRAAGGVAALVGLLAPGRPAAVREQAAAALANLCAGSAANPDSIRECGGVAALIYLLAPGSPAALQQVAAVALANLCAANEQNRACVKACGGHAALYALLTRDVSAAAVRDAAAAALDNLGYDCSVVHAGGAGAPRGWSGPWHLLPSGRA